MKSAVRAALRAKNVSAHEVFPSEGLPEAHRAVHPVTMVTRQTNWRIATVTANVAALLPEQRASSFLLQPACAATDLKAAAVCQHYA
jgi:predicted GTPase